MRLHKFTLKKIVIFSLIALSVLALAEFVVIFNVNQINSQSFEIIQERNPKSYKLNGIYIKTNEYHHCTTSNASNDGFFECKIINNSDIDITNWTLEIPFLGDAIIMNSWNADAVLKGNKVIVTAESKESEIIKGQSTFSFELYLNYKQDTEYNTIKFTGTKLHKLSEYPIHTIIIIIAGIIIVALIASTIVSRYMQREINILNRLTERSYAIIDQTMKTFVNFIDAKDEYTKGHSTRVAEYSRLIANRMGYSQQFQQDIYYMGLMHDIGKITVPDNILNKTGHLTTEEWAVIQMHTENGARLLQNFTVIPEIKDAVLYHHERYDGKGYLAHLKGEEIPLCARIICVADSYDAMSTTRCYRLKYSRERIIQELERCAGKQFDPTIAKVMIDLLKDGTI